LTIAVAANGAFFGADWSLEQVILAFQFSTGGIKFFIAFFEKTLVSHVLKLKIVLVYRNFVQTYVV
jgi:hypothetical protein